MLKEPSKYAFIRPQIGKNTCDCILEAHQTMALSACSEWTLNSQKLVSVLCNFLVVYSQHVLLNSAGTGMFALWPLWGFRFFFPF